MDAATLAALAGNALVTAAVTDAWEGFRSKIARLFGHGEPDPQIERRLDATRQQLAAAPPGELAQERSAQEEAWKVRFADLLADHPGAFGELDALVREVSANMPAASGHSAAAGRDMTSRADHGSAAAGVVHGNIYLGPTMPGPASS